jgi:diguanylate cyclase (GGDEF)-like protein
MEQSGIEKRGMEKYLDSVEKQPRGRVLVAALLIVIGIAIVDYLTGVEIIFSFVYLLPIAMVAWVIGRKEGIFLSVTSSLTWTLVNQLFREESTGLFTSNWNSGAPGLLVSYWNAAAHFGFFLIVTLLVSEVRQLLEKERSLARTDFLTGALNRRAFYETSRHEILRVKRTKHPFTIIYLDIDAFKAVNDQQGHDVGDALLHLVTETISGNIRSFDSVGRLGGDEFAILLPETNYSVAKSVAPRLQKVLLQKMHEKGYPVTFSMGALTFLTPPEDVDAMLKQVDEILYQVKNAGKNAIQYAEHST